MNKSAVEVAQKTVAILGGKRILNMMISAKSFMFGGADPYLSFRFTSRNQLHANYIKLKTSDNETYVVEFGRVYGQKYKMIKVFEDVKAAGLKSLFETETALKLSY